VFGGRVVAGGHDDEHVGVGVGPRVEFVGGFAVDRARVDPPGVVVDVDAGGFGLVE
jgi:hypothetical protein